jgi:hypothetical protein
METTAAVIELAPMTGRHCRGITGWIRRDGHTI